MNNVINKPAYGHNSPEGWHKDHHHPVAKGGTDHPKNMQPLQSAQNRDKSDTYPYPDQV
jgi:hypothetical protein